jgi:ATP-dependent helicase/nuclease subunit A
MKKQTKGALMKGEFAMMMTPEQQAAIDLRDCTVVVSAAAGAGKTRVLVERLMGCVTDTARPRHIDEFLIVTYTRAAAGELRGRIFARLRELLDAEPGNPHLKEQLNRVYTARIGTLDSYCREIILQNAALAGLPTGYRSGEEAEMELLRSRILDETLDALYERAADDPEDVFHICANTYGDERGDWHLGNLIGHIWQKARCHADPMGWLKAKTDDFPGGDWQAILFGQALCIAQAFHSEYRNIGDAGHYEPALRHDLHNMDCLIECLRRGDWDETAALLEAYSFERLKPLPKGEVPPPGGDAFKDARSRWKKALDGKLKTLIYGSLEQHIQDAKTWKPLLAGLYYAVCEYDRALMEEKLRLSVLEFTDVQRIALGLLEGKPPAPFAEILVDEFQDINPLQDAIITALSRDGENIFYVGDARQSIYRFQMAEPGIFLDKLSHVQNKVLLTKNFRSAGAILDAVNFVFSRIDCPEMGVLRESEFLISGKQCDVEEPVEVLVSGDELPEAEAVAIRLRELVESGEARAEDCVILMRSPKSRLPEYRAALEREGLGCSLASGEGFYGRPEVQAVLSLLEFIDNSRLDVPLLSVLRSPMVGCTSDELAELRSLADGPLCGCLALSVNPKVAKFAELCQNWRTLAPELPPHLLAARVMADTALLQKVRAAASENLLLLPELLREYRGDLRGLSDWAAAVAPRRSESFGKSSPPGGVRILSIHASKGLEFPVVVVAGLSKQLNLQDSRARLLAHPRMGLGMKIWDGMSEVPTPSYRAVQAVMDSETRAEELRLLYVAMTRAERRLILSVGRRDAEANEMLPGVLSKGGLILNSTVAQWLLKVENPKWKTVNSGQWTVESGQLKVESIKTDPTVNSQLSTVHWLYPYAEAVDTPSKMTATGLKGRYPDGQVREDAGSLPSRDTSKLNASERGTATHLFLQFAEFAKCSTPHSAAAEASRLAVEGKLTAEQSEVVDTKAVAEFFQTKRGKLLAEAEFLRREQKFSLLIQNGDLPGLVLPEGEKVLLQGVIDCFYETPEGMVLLDFKTDRVKPGMEEERAERYRPQMEAYAFALAAMTGKPVTERVLVFLSTGREIYCCNFPDVHI